VVALYFGLSTMTIAPATELFVNGQSVDNIRRSAEDIAPIFHVFAIAAHVAGAWMVVWLLQITTIVHKLVPQQLVPKHLARRGQWSALEDMMILAVCMQCFNFLLHAMKDLRV
jgi:hypothetical protein